MADYFFPSIEDARALSGLDDADANLAWAHGLGAKTVFLKLGADGVIVSDGKKRERIAGITGQSGRRHRRRRLLLRRGARAPRRGRLDLGRGALRQRRRGARDHRLRRGGSAAAPDGGQISTRVPSSITRLVGMLK